jgi:hypothetical protein
MKGRLATALGRITLALIIVGVAILPSTAPVRAATPANWPPFLIGASYQGPADRAWRGDYWAGWADDRFDATLVDADFQRASLAGLNTLRIFVQLDLMRDIRDEKWTKLDAVLDLADQRGLRLILTLADYDEPRINRLAATAGAIAQRYAGRPTIIAYDLKNEPTFWMLQSAMYPNNQRPPLFSRTLIDTYGEQAARHYVAAFRVSDEGQHGPLAIPDRFSDDEAYVYHNNWLLSYKLSQEASTWATSKGRADVEYFSQPEAARWRTFMDVLDTTYRAWLEPQIQAIRAVDPATPITIGQHDPLIAALPANQMLDVITLHRYGPPGPDGLKDIRRQLLALKAMFPDRPVVLGEFGHRATDLGEDVAAVEETAVWLQLLSDGFAGGLKWMLTDTRDGTDTMGMFRIDGSPRPVAYATVAIAQVAAGLDDSPAPILTLDKSGDGATCYRFDRDRFLALAGRCFSSAIPWELGTGARQVFVRREADGSYLVAVTAPSTLQARPAGAGGISNWALTEVFGGDPSQTRTLASASAVDVQAGRIYRLAPAR